MAKYYTVPPAGFDPRFGYTTSTSTSPAPEEYDYYHPNPYARGSPGRSSSKRGPPQHVRTASYSAPRVSTWQGQSAWGTPVYYTAAPRYTSPSGGSAKHPPQYDYVSSSPLDPRRRRASMSGRAGPEVVEIGRDGRPTTATSKRRHSMRLPTRRIFVDAYDDSSSDSWDWDQPIIQNVQPRQTKATPPKKKKEAPRANLFSRKQSTVEADSPVRSRARRNSTATTTSTRPKPAPAAASPKSSREPLAATSADAARHKIPAGYVLKNWDPTERPVLLLGSVFDANSLGKWIYDWTVYTHDAGSPLAEMAGELWLMLIKFSHKMKRAEDGTGRVRGRDNRQLLADFQESGNRLWRRLLNLLKVCEDFMWRVAKRSSGARATMGERSGVEFVRTIFGRDRELEETERLMSSVRLWIMRFDANCEDLLRSRKH